MKGPPGEVLAGVVLGFALVGEIVRRVRRRYTVRAVMEIDSTTLRIFNDHGVCLDIVDIDGVRRLTAAKESGSSATAVQPAERWSDRDAEIVLTFGAARSRKLLRMRMWHGLALRIRTSVSERRQVLERVVRTKPMPRLAAMVVEGHDERIVRDS